MSAATRPGRTPHHVRGTAPWAGPVTLAAFGAGAVGTLAVVDPATSGIYPTCPSLALFGVLCPLCGGLRGVHALASGDLVGAVSSNLLLPLVVVLVGWGWLAWTLEAMGRPVLSPPRPGRRAWVGLTAFAVAYTVLRNLTGTPFEVLAP